MLIWPSSPATERLLVSLGIKLDSWNQNGEYFSSLQPPPKVCFKPFYRRIPADLSAAAFLIVAALITPGSEIILKNVGLNPTRTGLIDVLWEMGAQIEIKSTQSSAGEPCGNLIVRHSHLHGVDVSGFLVVRMIDEFPAFAIAAAFADGDSRVMDAGELRLKESDRIGQLVSGLSDLGIGAEETADGFVIHGGRLPTGGEVDSHNDHRLAMAFALSGLSGGAPVTVTGSNVIAESFPEFASALQHLGADTHEGREK
jgi:3-phosphoshikimate 1-carboxyvinyltransferase